MQSEFDGNVVCHGVELLLFVSMLFVLAIHHSFNSKGIFCTSSIW